MASDRVPTTWAVAISIGATLVVLELGARLLTGSLSAWGPASEVGADSILDPDLGYIPHAALGVRVREGFEMHTREHGIRSNGDQRPTRERPVTLVVGDSYAFGDEVLDSESWPAVLERAVGAPVVNAGIAGFGLDQSVLRAERLAPVIAPDRIVVSFIPHDVRRCAMAIWSGYAKPWFEVDAGELRVHPIGRYPMWRHAIAPTLSRSVLIDSLFHDALRRDGPDTFAHHRGDEVACLLLDRLAALGRERGATVLVLAQPQTPLPNEAHYPPDPDDPRPDAELASIVIRCAEERHLPVVDAISAVAALPAVRREALFRGKGHNSPEGNRVIAEIVREALERLRSSDSAMTTN
jgi:hypothetical protein